MDIFVDEYGNGDRPTASGTIDGREFSFRLMSGNWHFAVGKLGVEGIWWYSGNDELEFEKRGQSQVMWHTGSLPEFLEGIEAYLDFRNVEAREKLERLESSEVQARVCFAGWNPIAILEQYGLLDEE